ncbi:JmjC-domain-containing protein, partial [Aureobasidium melanogenum]
MPSPAVATEPANVSSDAALPEASNLSKHPEPAHALTPPTSEDNNIRVDDDASSDLSELDLDMEDEEEIEPDHYWGDGKVPVFKPTMAQFRDFKKFIDKIDKYGMKSGIVKVIPPQEWRDDQPALDELVKTIKIKNPISQEFMGTHGIYTQANIEKQRSYNLPEWKSLTEEPQYQPPARRGERRRNQAQVSRSAATKTRAASTRTSTPKDATSKRKPGRPRKHPLKNEEDYEDEISSRASQVPPTPTSPVLKSTEPSEHTTPSKPKPKPRGRQPKAGQQKSVSSRRMNNTTETNDVVDEAAFKDFDYHMDDLEEFTPERCAELETAYWKSLTFAQPMYAADMPGSLFKDECDVWNVAKLPNLLDVLGTKVPGVNTAYLYMGMWKATFAWHLEDVDLYSINYIHFGAPKQWYSISQEDARKFEKAMKSIWPNDSKACDQFLRHKTYLISPEILQKQFGIKVNKLVHYEGEFVITYPYGYHSGYNIGYNCAESVNFATESWLDYGRIAKKCECEADSVWVDVGEIERKLRGEPTPEYYEETDDDDEDEMELDGATDLPSPPASVAGKPQAQARKRKRDPKERDAGKKKKRIRILIKGPHREPCVLCPNDPPNEPLLPTDNGQKAHRCCALYTPETWINSEDGVEKVVGVAGIDKARLDLKCNFCRSKRGACFQCQAKKCTRAYHATCALAAGVQIDVGPVPTFGEDGTEYFEEGIDLRCRFHRSKRGKNMDSDALENNKLINTFARSLKKGDAIQAQYLGGDIFAGIVEENRPGESAVLINVLPSGDQVEVEWKWLLVLDPIDSERPKPSPTAIPMPEGMSKQSVSIGNRQDGVPILETTFHEDANWKWAEFRNLQNPPQGYSTAVIKNPDQVKIDLNKPDQLYYYLPKKSTEAKGRFTDDPKGQNHVFMGDFMERVKPAKPFRPVAPSYAGGYTGGYTMPQVSRPVQAQSSERPYTYKPKTPAYPTGNYGLDQRALASQKQFIQQADPRRASYATGLYSTQPIPPLRQQHSEPTRQQSAPLRPFSEGYYSSRTLPAAIPGEYSQFHQQVRRTSGGALAAQPYQTQPYGSTSQIQQPSASSPQTGAGHAQQQASRAPLQPYSNLINDLVNKSGPAAQPPLQNAQESSSNRPTAQSPPTANVRPANGQWTPPSQIYHAYDRANSQLPPQNSYRPQPTYQTAQEFQQQIGIQARQPSVSNRWGAYDRMLRDAASAQSTLPHPSDPYNMSTTTAGGAPNGFSIPTTYPSPKAPTASPLSDTQTPRAPSPGINYRGQGLAWGGPPQQSSPHNPVSATNNTLPSLQSMTQGGPFAAASHPPPPQQ